MNNDYKDWLRRAHSSLELAKMVGNEMICYEDLCYQAQQAVEKGVKALLIYYGIEPEKTHNLYVLLQELEQHTPLNEEVKEVIRLTKYAVQTRYPGDYVEIEKSEYELSIKIAENCLAWVDGKIK